MGLGLTHLTCRSWHQCRDRAQLRLVFPVLQLEGAFRRDSTGFACSADCILGFVMSSGVEVEMRDPGGAAVSDDAALLDGQAAGAFSAPYR